MGRRPPEGDVAAEFAERSSGLSSASRSPDAVTQAIETSMAAYWLSLGRGGGVVHDGPDLKWAYT
ncbi:MAG: hypothetical protein ACRDI2_20470, partial [Chloroflexota bacterium]